MWTGPHPVDGEEVQFVDGPPEGAPRPDLPAEPAIGVPGFHPGEIGDLAAKLMARAR